VPRFRPGKLVIYLNPSSSTAVLAWHSQVAGQKYVSQRKQSF